MSSLVARFAANTFWLGRYLERTENLARILHINETYARDKPEGPDWQRILDLHSDSERFHENHEDAERMIREGMFRFPDSEKMRFQLGAVYEGQGKLEETEAVFQGILKSHPQHAGVLNYLGYMLADRGLRLLESLDYISKAVEIEPHNGAYLDSLGWVYFKLNQLDLAETNLLLALRLSDSDPTIYEHLGDLYSKLKQYARARTYYRHSVSLAENEEQEKVQKKLTDLELLLEKNL